METNTCEKSVTSEKNTLPETNIFATKNGGFQ